MDYIALNETMSNTVSNASTGTLTVFTETEDILTKVFYVWLSVINIAGNSMVIYIIYRERAIHSTVNLLIVNLSLSDIVAGIAIYPYLFIEISTEDEKANRANYLCGFKVGMPLFFGASTVNFLTLTVLSLSRYLLINHPTKLKWRIQKSYVKWISIATWIIGMSLPLPNIVSYKYVPQTKLCKRFWPGWFNRPAFFSVTAFVYFFPLLSLILTYISSVYSLWFKASTRRLARSNSNAKSSRKKVAVLLGLLILAFCVCWAPFVIYWILSAATQYFKDTVEGHVDKARFMRFSLIAALVNTCLDPCIYAFGNRQIKDGARRLLGVRRLNNVEPITTGCE